MFQQHHRISHQYSTSELIRPQPGTTNGNGRPPSATRRCVPLNHTIPSKGSAPSDATKDEQQKESRKENDALKEETAERSRKLKEGMERSRKLKEAVEGSSKRGLVTTTVDYYSKVFGFEPPQFYEEKELSDGTFAMGDLNATNLALLQNSWQLTPIDGSTADFRNPLENLTRMGLIDLLDHDESENVTLVLPTIRNKKLIRKVKPYAFQMQRKSGVNLWIVKNAKVKELSMDAVTNLKELLEIRVHDISFTVPLTKFRFVKYQKGKGDTRSRMKDSRMKKIEIWKSLPEKSKQVSDFILHDALKKEGWQKDENRRNAIVNFLLGESKGDRDMTFTIVWAYSRLRTMIAEHYLTLARNKVAKKTKKIEQIEEETKKEGQRIRKETKKEGQKRKAAEHALQKATRKLDRIQKLKEKEKAKNEGEKRKAVSQDGKAKKKAKLGTGNQVHLSEDNFDHWLRIRKNQWKLRRRQAKLPESGVVKDPQPESIFSVSLESPSSRLGIQLKDVKIGNKVVASVKFVEPGGLGATNGLHEGMIAIGKNETSTDIVKQIKNGPYPIILQFYNLASESDALNAAKGLKRIQEEQSTAAAEKESRKPGDDFSNKSPIETTTMDSEKEARDQQNSKLSEAAVPPKQRTLFNRMPTERSNR